MKPIALVASLLGSVAVLGISSPASAEICYAASGSVRTANTTPITQSGVIELTLTKGNGKAAFDAAGELQGTITGADGFGVLWLTHTAKFPNDKVVYKDSFVTKDDSATILGVAGVDSNGTACAFSVREKITSIVAGAGFFEGVSRVDITADGTVSSCPGNNQNSFSLSGTLCRQ